jgi:hypothetical protein
MPWCGYWGTSGGYWWVLPLIGAVFMIAMLFACFRRPGCMGRRSRPPGEPFDLRREVEGLKDEVRKLQHKPS